MHTRTLATLILLPLAVGTLTGCASLSTTADVQATRTLVESRVNLPLPDRTPERWQDDADPDVTQLLAKAETLALEDAIRIGLLNNRDLRAELRSLGVARGQLVQAGLVANPEFEAQVRFPTDRREEPQWDLGIGFDLKSILLRGKRQGAAAAELEAARVRAASAAIDLAFDIRAAYYDYQATQQEVEVLRTAMLALGASFTTARELRRVGNVTELDLVTEEAAYEAARLAVSEAELGLIQGRERLNVLLGLSGDQTKWRVTTRLPEPSATPTEVERLESRAIEASLELAETRAKLTAAARRLGLAEVSGWMPDITVGVHAEHDGNRWEVGPALSGRLPLFDQQQGNVVSRRAEFYATRERYVAQAVTIRAAVRAARARAALSEARVRQYQKTLLPMRDRVVHQTLLQYNAMHVSVFQLLQARRDQLETGRLYVQALLEYWQSRAALDRILAGRVAGFASDGTRATNRTATVRSREEHNE